MKKNGFTLAEVLITLAIIGVVATLTLPALMTNTAEQQAKTAFKKGINTMTEAVQMNQAIEGFDYAGLSSDNTGDEDARSLYGILAKRTNIDYAKTNNQNSADVKDVLANATGNYAVFLRDGAAIIFNPAQTLKTVSAVNAQEDDGLVHGVSIIYDTNGIKGPNILSNCDGNATQIAGNYSDKGKSCTKKSRVIKDQFGMRLRGDYVVPNGPAARWAFEN